MHVSRSLSRAALVLLLALSLGGPAGALPPRPMVPHVHRLPHRAPAHAIVRPAPGGHGQVIGPDHARTLTAAERKNARFHMDFDKVDLLEVIKYIAQWTDKNFILPENVRGRITIIGPKDVTADEAYDAFLAALEVNDLTLTPTGKFLKVVPKRDASRSPVPTFLDGGGTIPLNEQLVTKLVRLKYTQADQIRNVVQQFTTRTGNIVTYPPDVLIISDDAENVVRVQHIIDAIDQPGSANEINVLQVEHANAQQLAQTLLQIFQPQGAAGQPGGYHPTFVPMAQRRVGQPMYHPPVAANAQPESAAEVSKIIADERTNKLIIIAGGRTFDRIKALVAQLDVPTATGQIHVYYLENADAKELASTLNGIAQGITGNQQRRNGLPVAVQQQAAATGMLTGKIKVTADKATNSLLVIASPSDYRNLVHVIQELDVPRRQVFIETVIMEVRLHDENTAGLDFHSGYAFTNVKLPGTNSGTAPLIVGSEVSSPAASLNLAGLASMSGFLAGIQGPPINVNGVDITLPSFGVILNALQNNSDVNVLSTPDILTSDNQDADIEVGESVPFQTAVTNSYGSGSLSSLANLGTMGTSSLTNSTAATSLLSSLGSFGLGGYGYGGIVPIQRQPVELKLKIKPQINQSDYVKLKIDLSNEEIASVDPQRGPTTSKRAIKTTVVAKDQSTVVIGGLIQDRVTRGEEKVPILGSLPLIGMLFRNTDVTRERTNLLVFLTPYIIRGPEDFRRIFERKMKEREEFVARYFGNTEQYRVTVDYARKKGPLAILHEDVHEELQKAENGGPGTPNEQVITPKSLNQSQQPTPPAPVPAPTSPPTAPPGG